MTAFHFSCQFRKRCDIFAVVRSKIQLPSMAHFLHDESKNLLLVVFLTGSGHVHKKPPGWNVQCNFVSSQTLLLQIQYGTEMTL